MQKIYKNRAKGYLLYNDYPNKGQLVPDSFHRIPSVMPWFVKIERGIIEKAQFDKYVPAHQEYVKELIHRGHQARSGYWAERGGGMLLFQADSLAEAQAIVQEDPLIKNGCVEYELHEWRIIVS